MSPNPTPPSEFPLTKEAQLSERQQQAAQEVFQTLQPVSPRQPLPSHETPQPPADPGPEPVVEVLENITVNPRLVDRVVEVVIPTPPGSEPIKLHLSPAHATKISQQMHQAASVVRRGRHVKTR